MVCCTSFWSQPLFPALAAALVDAHNAFFHFNYTVLLKLFSKTKLDFFKDDSDSYIFVHLCPAMLKSYDYQVLSEMSKTAVPAALSQFLM